MVWLTANILCLCKLLLVFKVTWHRTFSKMWLNYTAHPFLHPQENINYYYHYYLKRNMINKFTHSAFNSFVNKGTFLKIAIHKTFHQGNFQRVNQHFNTECETKLPATGICFLKWINSFLLFVSSCLVFNICFNRTEVKFGINCSI